MQSQSFLSTSLYERTLAIVLLVFFCQCKITAQIFQAFESLPSGQYTGSTSVTGWTLDSTPSTYTAGSCGSSTAATWSVAVSEFSIRQTPLFNQPHIGTIGHSPLGGTKIAQFHNASGSTIQTRLRTQISVSQYGSSLHMAYAGSWDGSGHACCDQPFYKINIYNCFGNFITSFSLTPAGPSCPSGATSYSINSAGISYTNWQAKTLDLTPYSGSCVFLEIINGDCNGGCHHGSLYFDANVSGPLFAFGNYLNNFNPVNYCQNTGAATISAPLGYATYSWVSSSGLIPPWQSTLQILSIINPIPNTTYTVYLYGNTITSMVYTLVPTQIQIAALGSSSSCINGSSGSATVGAQGNATGYNYAWTNTSNSVVGTGSVVNNLPPGNYTITVSSPGSASACGIATSTINIGASPPQVIDVVHPYCGSEAYLTYPNGSGYQWYVGTTAVTGSLGGTASVFTVSSPGTNTLITMGVNTSQGCRDSVRFSLTSYTPIPVSISVNTICPNTNNGQATITLPPSYGMQGVNYFFVNSLGTTTPLSASLNPTSAGVFTISNLSANGSYSLHAFDGSCKYSNTFSVSVNNFNFNINPSPSLSLCPSGSVNLTASFSAVPPSGLYTYSWSPNIFITGNTTNSLILVSPSTAVGTQLSFIYSVAVTSSLANCTVIKTVTVTAINPVTPTINPIPDLCASAGNFTISASPSGGSYKNNIHVSPAGILYPSSQAVGINSVTYVTTTGSCQAAASATFLIKSLPVLSVIGNNNICAGVTATLSALGANTYSWSTGATSNFVMVTPTSNTTYSVTGTGTNGCSSTATIMVNSAFIPTLSVAGPTQVCAGAATTIQLSGANSYFWNTGNSASWAVLSPTASTNYTITGSNSPSCKTTTVINLAVIPNPTLSLTGDFKICAGENAPVFVIGADQYIWSTGDSGPSLTVTPMITSIYTVVGTATLGGCKDSATWLVEVEACTNFMEYSRSPGNFKIYPNPGAGIFFLESNENTELKLLDVLGQTIRVFSITTGNNLLDLSLYENGCYFLQTSDLKSNQSKNKLIIQR